MYPYDDNIPATVPCARWHARVWIAAGKVWLMLHHEPGEARQFSAGTDWPFAIDNSLPAAKAAARLTSCMHSHEQKDIREPLAGLITATRQAIAARLAAQTKGI